MISEHSRKYFITRPEEWKLLWYAILITVVAFMLSILHHIRTTDFILTDIGIPIRFIIACFLAHLLLVAFGFRGDSTLLPTVSAITGFGLAFQYRLGYIGLTTPTKPAFWIYPSVPVIVAVTAVIFKHGRILFLKRLGWFWVLVTPLIPVTVILHGNAFRGGLFGPGKTTPTEFVKPLFLIATSWLLIRYGPSVSAGIETRRRLMIYLLILSTWISTTVAFLFIHDLGMIMALTLLLIVLLSAALGRLIYILIGVFSSLIASVLIIRFLPKGFARFEGWLEPFQYPDTYGYQIIQSLFALFHGAFWGRGIGFGLPGKIPLVASDLVYAAISEETGLLGGTLLLAGLLYLGYRGILIASQKKDPFTSLVVLGASSMIWIQVFLNVGGAIKLIPLTGVPLPFVSHGGSALIVFSGFVGLLLAASPPESQS